MSCFKRQALLTWVAALSALLLPLATQAETVSKSVTFTVEIVAGCKLGVGGSNPSSLGTIDFGQAIFLDQEIHATGTAGS